MLLHFPDAGALAGELALLLRRRAVEIDVHHFPDGESRLRLPQDLPEDIIIFRSLDDPDRKLVELLLAARGARNQGARRLTLVAPYLCYMRQDTAFRAGEVISQRIVGDFLAGLFDALVTADPHLHRTHSLADAVPAASATAVSASAQMADFLVAQHAGALLLGPDRESEQWVRTVARRAGLDFVVAEKQRHGDREVDISLPDGNYRDRAVIIVDDVASSGRTLATAARAALTAGAARVDALVTHALFAGDAVEVMHAAGIGKVYSSDSIDHASNAFSIAPVLAAALS